MLLVFNLIRHNVVQIFRKEMLKFEIFILLTLLAISTATNVKQCKWQMGGFRKTKIKSISVTIKQHFLTAQ